MSLEYAWQSFPHAVHLQIDYARQLNEQQFAAVTAPPGPALVIAGAGSGKTRALTYRVAYLLEQGIPADRILLLTFTNKAASEMMRRVADLLGQELPALWGGTFHSIGNRILRHHADRVGYQRDFTILDRQDAKELIDACIGEAEIDVRPVRFPKGDVLGSIFSMALNTQCSIPDTLNAHYGYFAALAELIEDVQQRYTARKRANNAMDFDDLLFLWLKLLQEHADLREQYQRRFQFVLVDEYQDTNQLQGDLIDLLAGRHHNVMVVGDDAQSIYSWRGANLQNIMNFSDRHPETRVYHIETNYRSTPDILKVANAAIAANLNQFVKQLAPARKSGDKPVLVACGDATGQASFVARRVVELQDAGVNPGRIAVLYRSHFHALELQLELTRRHIPFSITSGIRFFEQAHVKDVAAYLKLVSNPRDELSFKRLVQLLPGIGRKGAEKWWSRFSSKFKTPNSKLKDPDFDHPAAAALQSCAAAVPKSAAAGWAQFVATIAQLEAEPVRGKTAEMIQLVLEAGYEDYLQETYPNYHNRMEDLEQLAAYARQFESLEIFLTQLALLTNLEAEDDQLAVNEREKIRLSTIHQAKGLEFDVVFIIMLCEGLFPSARSMENQEKEEEERRLFYVAITRARNELYLSYTLIRGMQSRGGGVNQEPSRFLREIPNQLIDEWGLTR